jgi:tetratricopeptide (TPR) repeat protein
VHNDVPDYWHQYISSEMIARFDEYRDRALDAISGAGGSTISRLLPGRALSGGEEPPTERVCDAVRAYVLADHADALAAYGRRFADTDAVEQAIEEYEKAAELNCRLIPARHALVLLHCERREFERARQRVDEIRALDPDWPEGILADVEVPHADKSRPHSRTAVRRLLETQRARSDSPMREWFREKFHEDASLGVDEADAVVTARYLLQSKHRRPVLTAPQVEVLVVWARALAQRDRPSANIAAAGLGQLVERWYFPNYAKVQEICGQAMGSLLSHPRKGYGDPLDDIQKSVVKTVVARCKQYAKVERSNGNDEAAARWKTLSEDVAAWLQPRRRSNGRAALSVQEAYDRMIVANLRSLADLDPESKRVANQLTRLQKAIDERRVQETVSV